MRTIGRPEKTYVLRLRIELPGSCMSASMRRQYAHRAPIGALCEGSSMRLYRACCACNYQTTARFFFTFKLVFGKT